MTLIKHTPITAQKVLNVLTVLVTALLIVSISLETFMGSRIDQTQSTYDQIQFWICIYFLVDFVLLLFLSKDKKAFFTRYFIFILFSVPYATVLNNLAIPPSQELSYLLKFVPLLRGGAALFFLIGLAAKNRITSLFISYVFILFAVFYFQTLIFYIFERQVNHAVENYYDVLWWAAMTITTVGSTIIPLTAVGKVSTTILAVVGMTTLPIFTAYITSLIQRVIQKPS